MHMKTCIKQGPAGSGPATQLQGMFVILIVIYELAMYGIIGVECFVDFIRFLIHDNL